jgi:predicted  nucleic acid-binding Zn-ribbon protein|tara:strand:+ start:953 stop:1270 length:318 start_codon:yes stop_codon:yes gene_type:complete
MEFIELYAEYGAVGVVVILFAITFIKQSKVTETQAEALNSLQIENEGQSKNIENIESILLKFLDRWNRSDETRDRRHEDLVKEVNDMSDVLMEVKGSVSRINGSR